MSGFPEPSIGPVQVLNVSGERNKQDAESSAIGKFVS